VKPKILILLVLLFLCLFNSGEAYESEEAATEIKLKVSPFEVVLITYINGQVCPEYPLIPNYCAGDTLNISNELENVYYLDINGNLSTSVLNTIPQEIQRSDWLDVSVPAEDIAYRNTSYIVRNEDELGIFSVDSAYTYDGNYSIQNCSFWVYKDIGELYASVDTIVLTIPPGGSATYDPPLKLRLYRACDNTTVQMSVSSGVPGNWTSFNPEEIFLLPTGEENSTNITVTVPNATDYGVYYGWIFANAYGNVFSRNVSINLTVIVAPVNFYLKTTIPPDKKEVCQGSDVYAEVNITKLFSGQVDVNMTYQILYNGEVLTETKETLTLNDTLNSTIRIPILKVPSDAELDYHTFLAILQSNGNRTESSDTFKVISCITPPPTPGPGPSPIPAPSPAPTKRLFLNLSTNLLSVVTGNRTSFVATVENTGNTAVKDVKISIEGIQSDWIETIPSVVTIPAQGTQGYLVMITVPSNAITGVYQLEVKATDNVESNTEILTLVIGENLKEIVDLLLKEFEDAKLMAERALLVEDCLDITIIKTIHKDAEYAHQRGLEEYNKKDYAKAINWLEYAIPLERKVVSRVDINLEMELRASNSSRIIIPPFYEPDGEFAQAHIYFEGKDYEEICDPIEEIRKFIMIGLIFWPIIVIIIVFVVIIFVIFYRRKRKEERVYIMKRVKERLGKPEETV